MNTIAFAAFLKSGGVKQVTIAYGGVVENRLKTTGLKH